MIAGVADTHAGLWYLYDDKRLSFAAGDFNRPGRSGRSPDRYLLYQLGRDRLPYRKEPAAPNAYTDLKAALDDPDQVFKEAPFTADIVEAMRQVRRADVPDMPDRIVAATGMYFGVPVISRDGRIRASNIQTMW